MNSAMLYALVAATPLLSVAGCATPSQQPLVATLTYLDETEEWIAQSEAWMGAFRHMAKAFPRPLPQLEEDSAFNRHRKALEAHRSELVGADALTEGLRTRHASLSHSHARLQEAYGNMVSLAEKDPRHPGPEFAKDEPR